MNLRAQFYRYVGGMLVLLGPLFVLIYGFSASSRGDLMIVFAFLVVSGLQLIGMATVIEELRKP